MNSDRIVFIEGSGSEWYEQVIFILKSPNSAKAKNLVYEAEKIINDYMLTVKTANPKIERYKKSIAERAASSQRVSVRSEPPAAMPSVKKTVTSKRKPDFTSLLINICLVLASVLLGYIMHTVMI